ncbi:glutathione S-transferase 1-1-like [Lineus longissimus]|uniref:glutathione S-transferase 1-1-like n=1 Tax=Lineus longissimus TaxID=88925 RepID=UPI00315DB16A
MGCGISKVDHLSPGQGGKQAWGSGSSVGGDCPTLYVWPGSAPCRAVIMTCAAAGIDVNLLEVNLPEGHHTTEAFSEINPHKTVPVLNDKGYILWESRAIMMYLVSKYARKKKLYSMNLKERALVDRFIHFDIGILSKAVNDYTTPILSPGSPRAPKADGNLRTALDLLENDLIGVQYATGSHVTIADISMVASLWMLEAVNFDIGKWRLISGWISRMKALPFYEE